MTTPEIEPQTALEIEPEVALEVEPQATPEVQAAPITLKQSHVLTWAWPQIIQYCDLSTGLSSQIPPWKFAVLAKHDLIAIHGVPK